MVAGPINLGVIGLSDGNGHPFSFSAIFNGFDRDGMQASGWDVIYDYLITRDASEFGIDNVHVTHAWTQDADITAQLARAANIPHTVANAHDMLGEVDGVLIARDDYKTHFPLAKPFLEAGKFVFIDKPLSLEPQELGYFKPFMDSGKLMSCAGARYAKELDEIRGTVESFGQLKLVRGTVVNSMEKYGVHMLDGIFSVTGFNARRVLCVEDKHASMRITNDDGSLIYIDALGQAAKTLQFDFWSEHKRFHAETNDNFSMFRRQLGHFVTMMRSGTLPMSPQLVINTMRVLIAANRSIAEKREIDLDEIVI